MIPRVFILMVVSILLSVFSTAQQISLLDPAQAGAILYSLPEFKGESVQLLKSGATTNPDFSIRSIRILGNYELFTSRQIVIKEDMASVRMSHQEYTIRLGKDPRIAIAYVNSNFKGRAIYLKAFEIIDRVGIKSIKIGSGYHGNLVNDQGEMIELCNSISELTTGDFELQIVPGICR